MHPTEGAGRGEDHDATGSGVHRFAVTVKANVRLGDVHLVLVLLTQSLRLGRACFARRRPWPQSWSARLPRKPKGHCWRSRSPTATADQCDLGGVVVLSMNDGKGNSREGAACCDFRNFQGIFCEREVESMAMFLGFGLWFGME